MHTEVNPEVTQLNTGTVLDERYEVIDTLGMGGFGVVYKARQLSTNQIVAIKVMHAGLSETEQGAHAMERFKREMQLIGQLNHPNIVRLIDSGNLSDDRLYAVLEFVRGKPLSKVLREEGALKPYEAKNIMFEALDALCAAHESGVVHRDVKPENIMLTEQGFRRNALVLDFGIAGIVEEARTEEYQELTLSGRIHGTPAYMAPEQLRNSKTTPPIDIYAWGLVFLECLTGRRVIPGESLADIIAEQISPVPIWIPEEIRTHPMGAVIAKAVAKHPSQRYSSANEALRELERCSIDPEFSFPWTGGIIPLIQPSVTDTFKELAKQSTLIVGEADAPPSDQDLSPDVVPPELVERAGLSRNLLMAVALGILLVIGVVLLIVVSGGPSEELPDKSGSTAQPTSKPPLTSAETSPARTTASTSETSLSGVTAPPPETTQPHTPSFEVGQRYQPERTQGGDLVYFEGGSFKQGSSKTSIERSLELCRESLGEHAGMCKASLFSDQLPQHTVELEPWLLDRIEVTNAAYQTCIDEGACTKPNYAKCGVLGINGPFEIYDLDAKALSKFEAAITVDNLPVTCVNRTEAAAFCSWAGKRLPTETEWEYAATSLGTSLFPWGSESEAGGLRANAADRTLAEAMRWGKKPKIIVRSGLANVDRHAFSAPTGSFSKGASKQGVLDLSGNVAEWVADDYSAYAGGTIDEQFKGHAVLRGGSWAELGPWLSGRVRKPVPPETRQTNIGFRCAMSLSPTTP